MRETGAASFAATLAAALAVGGLLGAGAVLAFVAGPALSLFVLAIALPVLAGYSIRYLVARTPADPRNLTNLVPGVTGWALGAAIAAPLLPFGLGERAWAPVLAVQAAIAGAAWARFGRKHSLGWGHVRLRRLYDAAFMAPVASIALSIFVTGPTLALLFAAMQGETAISRAVFGAAAVPAGFAGLGLVRRGLWMLDVRRTLANLATSKARSAAVGVAEFAGVVAAASPLEIDDGTARLRVHLPVAGEPRVGERLLVVGEFVPPAELRPWRPPYGRWWARAIDRLIDPNIQAEAEASWNALGFGAPGEIYLVTLEGEARAKRRLLAGWWATFAMGVYLAGCAAYLALLAAGLPLG